MRRLIPALAVLPLAACVAPQADGSAPRPLAGDQARPQLALLEQVLREHFAGRGSGAEAPTTCVSRLPRPLTVDEEQALMARFVRLAPLARCRTGPDGPIDSIVGTRAEVIELYEFACTDAAHCLGWINRPGRPATRYAMEWQDGAWRFASDARLISE